MILPSTETVIGTATDRRAVFQRRESEVRGYCRSFPAVFKEARGSRLIDEDGNEYLDFLACAGALNYGHGHPVLVQAAASYLASGGPISTLDLHTVAKRDFLETFESLILGPRGLDHKVQFTGPTGTNGVEAALKIARKVTGRTGIISFTNGYHGMSLGALAATGNRFARAGAGVPLGDVTFMPYDGYHGREDTLRDLERRLSDSSGGLDLPAAAIVEVVQGEGGCNAASLSWLQRLAAILKAYGILLIVDDIQAGCGRTGTFFSFEPAGIVPDLIVLSKSIGGLGLPMTIVLLRPMLDRWKPGEHNGTFRGNNLAFVTARAALLHFWADGEFAATVRAKATQVRMRLMAIAARHPNADLATRGRGLMQGLACPRPETAAAISQAAWRRRLIIERAGPDDEVVKLMPPLTISVDDLDDGLDRLESSVEEVLG